MLSVNIPTDEKKLKQQIEALRYQISIEQNEKDKRIFEETLKILEQSKVNARAGTKE